MTKFQCASSAPKMKILLIIETLNLEQSIFNVAIFLLGYGGGEIGFLILFGDQKRSVVKYPSK
jgi:hypothetical protein